MTKEKLLELIEKYEWTDFECKKASRGVPDDAYKTVSAFANTSGGWLVFGVKDSNGELEVVGVETVDKVQNDFLSTLRSGEKLNRIITVKEESIEHDGKTLLVFFVPESPRAEKPVYLKGDIRQSYIRKGSGDEQCTQTEIERFLRDSAEIRFDSEVVADIPAENFFDEGTLRWYRRRFEEVRPGSHESLSDLEFLIEWNYVVEKEERLLPTRAAVLLFGKSRFVRLLVPRPILDYQRIDVAFDQYDSSRRWDDRIVFEENIFQTWFGLVEKYMRLAEHPFKVDPKTLRRDDDPPDYIAFREAAINLLIHQDYGDHTRKATIKFYLDRTIFWNPGDAFATDAELLEPTEKELRNPMIVAAFRRIGMSDQAGSGIRAIFKNWHELGNVPPILHNDKAGKDFELILLKEPLLSDKQKRFQQEVGVHLASPEADLFAYACEKGEVTLLDVRKVTASTQAQARAILDRLVVQALLEPVDSHLYRLTEAMQRRYRHFVEDDIDADSGQEPDKKEEGTGQVPPKYPRSTPEVSPEVKKVLLVMVSELSRSEIQQALGLKDEKHFREKYLQPALEEAIEMTIPDKPRSSKQKYRLTAKGKQWLQAIKQEDER